MILFYKVAYLNYKKLTSPATYYQQLLLVAFTWCKHNTNGTLYLRTKAVPHRIPRGGIQNIFCKNGAPVLQGKPFSQNTTMQEAL